MTQNIYKVTILRLGHRPFRDKRITTHCALVSRAFGAERFCYSGVQDNEVVEVVKKVRERWGGDFKMEYVDQPLAFAKNFKESGGVVIHLTMYGENITDKIKDIKGISVKNLLLIVGGSKVPREYYEVADYNIAIGNQPHSEVSALAIFLYMLNNDCLNLEFENRKIKIIPSNNNKKVINL